MNTQRKIKAGDDVAAHGHFVMKKHRAGDIKWHRDATGKVVVCLESLQAALGRPLYAHPVVFNKVVSGSGGYGRNLIMRALAGDITYGIEIDSAKIGTGTTPPVDGDTDIETVGISGIVVALMEVSNDELIVSFFIPDADLPDDTYTEFSMHIGGRLFARALITPTFAKGTNEDTTIEYTVSISG